MHLRRGSRVAISTAKRGFNKGDSSRELNFCLLAFLSPMDSIRLASAAASFGEEAGVGYHAMVGADGLAFYVPAAVEDFYGLGG